MARKIDITNIAPSEVLKIIEKSPKIKRIEFGKLSDNKSRFIYLLSHPFWGSLFLISIWFFVHYLFIHKDFVFEKDKDETLLIQYGAFLLSNGWTYVIIFTQTASIAKWGYSRGINRVKIQNEL